MKEYDFVDMRQACANIIAIEERFHGDAPRLASQARDRGICIATHKCKQRSATNQEI